MADSNINTPVALRGRPDQLTDARAAHIVNAVANTVPIEVALAACSIKPRTLRRYRQRARKYLADKVAFARYQKFYQFLMDLQVAEAYAEMSLIGIIRNSATTNAADAKYLLERRYRRRWGQVQQVEHSGKDGAAIPVEFVLAVPKPMATDPMMLPEETQ